MIRLLQRIFRKKRSELKFRFTGPTQQAHFRDPKGVHETPRARNTQKINENEFKKTELRPHEGSKNVPTFESPKSTSAHPKNRRPAIFGAGARVAPRIRGLQWVPAKDVMATIGAAIGSCRETVPGQNRTPPQKYDERSHPQTRGPAPLCTYDRRPKSP